MKVRTFPLVLAIGVLAISGCSSGGTKTPPAGPPAGGATATGTATAGNPCADAANTIKQHVNRAEVTSVDMTGVCTIATVLTTLADSDLDKAVQICDSAAEVAYTGGTVSLAVQGSSGKELALGLQGEPCIGEP